MGTPANIRWQRRPSHRVTRTERAWRGVESGADQAAAIAFTCEVQISGRSLPAGKYNRWAIPRPEPWTVIFSTVADVYHTPYPGEEQDALRVDLRPERGAYMETLAFYFPVVEGRDVVLRLHWGGHNSAADQRSVMVPGRGRLRRFTAGAAGTRCWRTASLLTDRGRQADDETGGYVRVYQKRRPAVELYDCRLGCWRFDPGRCVRVDVSTYTERFFFDRSPLSDTGFRRSVLGWQSHQRSSLTAVLCGLLERY